MSYEHRINDLVLKSPIAALYSKLTENTRALTLEYLTRDRGSGSGLNLPPKRLHIESLSCKYTKKPLRFFF